MIKKRENQLSDLWGSFGLHLFNNNIPEGFHMGEFSISTRSADQTERETVTFKAVKVRLVHLSEM